MRARSIAVISLPVVAVVVVAGTRFSGHWRIIAAERLILTPWLRPAYLGDGKPATQLLLCYPMGLAMNSEGELLISDRGRDRRGRVIWRVDREGIAHIVAGTSRQGNATGESALKLSFSRPESMAVAADRSIFVSDGFNHAVYRIDVEGKVARVAGTGSPGFSGDGGLASEALLFRPADVRLDGKGNLFIANVRIHRVRVADGTT